MPTVQLSFKFIKYSFSKNFSTGRAFSDLIDCVSGALDGSQRAVGALRDCINHEILQCKLSSVGIENTELGWFISYLKSRKQRIFFFYLVKIINQTGEASSMVYYRFPHSWTLSFHNICK
ncbi:hypothetical protein J6590_014679 [Homalodisca vitripennis]|nr:hypothetical protein J6590_014679 [Homalodisca vitripennis]